MNEWPTEQVTTFDVKRIASQASGKLTDLVIDRMLAVGEDVSDTPLFRKRLDSVRLEMLISWGTKEAGHDTEDDRQRPGEAAPGR